MNQRQKQAIKDLISDAIAVADNHGAHEGIEDEYHVRLEAILGKPEAPEGADSPSKVHLLRRTVGNATWLDGLSDHDWHIVWTEILPCLLGHADQREAGEQEAADELDALLAQKVMGWHLVFDGCDSMVWFGGRRQKNKWDTDDVTRSPRRPWAPTTDIEAAWALIEQVRARWPRCWVDISNVMLDPPNGPVGWHVTIRRIDVPLLPNVERAVVGYADGETVQLAICRAALEAVERLRGG